MLINSYGSFCVCFLTGVGGSGKSYICARDVLRRLVESDVRVVTNLPLELDALYAFAAKRSKKPIESFDGRVRLIDKETLASWRKVEIIEFNGKKETVVRGPWDFPDDQKANVDFILDECHLFIPKKHKQATEIAQRWEAFLGEARHDLYARLLFVSQDQSKVAPTIVDHSQFRYELSNTESRRDPYFRIPMRDWYEVVASFTGDYRPKVAVAEYRRILEKLRPGHTERVTLDATYFPLYRSYQVAGGGSRDGAAAAPLREFQKRGRFFPKTVNGQKLSPTWLWFLKRHAWRFFLAFTLVGLVLWVCFFGGMKMGIGYFLGSVKHRIGGSVPTIADPIGKGQKAPEKSAVPEKSIVKAAAKLPTVAKGGGVNAVQLAQALKGMPADKRATIEKAMALAASELTRTKAELAATGERTAVELPPVDAPPIDAFIGSDAVMVEGRKLVVGDELFLAGGAQRVRIEKIDRAARMVFLEDRRVLRFRVPVGVGRGVSLPGGKPNSGKPIQASAGVSGPVQSVGSTAKSAGSEPSAKGEKSILKRGADAPGPVLKAAG